MSRETSASLLPAEAVAPADGRAGGGSGVLGGWTFPGGQGFASAASQFDRLLAGPGERRGAMGGLYRGRPRGCQVQHQG
jgi:hypothetical protein